MNKRGLNFKTYGRSATFSKQSNDFDKVFSGGNSTGNSPFATSDSSTEKSIDFNDSHLHGYDLRGPFCNSLRDVSNEASISHDSLTFSKPPRNASKRNRGREKTTKMATRKTSKPVISGKENSIDSNVPDYDAIAEDSFVVERESELGVTKCSTPLANSSIEGSRELPILTPILYTDDCSDAPHHVNDSPNIHTFSLLEKSGCDVRPSDDKVARRSSRLKAKLITSRKLLIEEDQKIVSLTPNKDSEVFHASSCNEAESLHEKISTSTDETIDMSADDLLKRIGQNISHLAAINLSLNDMVLRNSTSPSENCLGSSNTLDDSKVVSDCPSFSASRDLFSSVENQSDLEGLSYNPELENSNLEGLSCIPEEESVYEDSHHSLIVANEHPSKSLLARLSTHSVCEHVQRTAKEKLFDICDQEDYISFSTCIPTRVMNACVKIGEGVYGEVFRSTSKDPNVAIKIIPMEGNFDVNDCPQKTYEEILPEAVIAKELSDLTCGFCHVSRISCVQGSFPAHLLREWDRYAERTLSENDRPDIFPKDQLFAVFEFADGGTALEKFEMSNHRETLSVLRQVVFALAVAENELEFEHRDLHIGNVLVKRVQEPTVKFKLCEDEIEFASEGVVATIIDFTISRLKKDGCAVFCDVSTDEGLFEGSGDIQFDVYRDMRKINQNDWSRFCPSTNILWTQYLCKKLLTAIKVKDSGRDHRDSLRRLRQLNGEISKHESCFHLAMNVHLWNF